MKACVWIAVLTYSLVGASAIKLSDEPELSELHRFTKMDGKHFNLAEEIGDEYLAFGTCLMQDSDGSIIDGIVSRLGHIPQLVNGEVLKEWSSGKGKVPVEWGTLLECLREVSLYELETEIKEEMDDVPHKQDKVFKTPRRKSHLSVYDDSHPVIDVSQLFTAFSEISDWESVCTNLGVANVHMDAIRHSSWEAATKKEACLREYYEYGQADWSHVVIAVAEPPLNNRRVACKIAHDHIGMDKKECHTYLGMDHDEL